MTDPSATQALIAEFVELAMVRRRRAVPSDVKARMQELDEHLRAQIDGARPAPQVIAGPSTAPHRSLDVAPAEIRVSPSTEPAKPLDLDGFATQVPLSEADAQKTNDVTLADHAESAYTWPQSPAFMTDYYGTETAPERLDGDEQPTKVVGADGQAPSLTMEARTLLGVRVARPAAADGPKTVPAAPIAPSRPVPTPSTPRAEPKGEAVVLYLMSGGSVRGTVAHFDPMAPSVEVMSGDGSTQFSPKQIMAVFFRIRSGHEPTPAHGAPVAVRLVNDREILGVTPDYEPGGMALTVVPEPRHGKVDRVWIPAWAVKGIEMDA